MYLAQVHVIKTFRKLEEQLYVSEQNKPMIVVLAGADTPFRHDTDREMLFPTAPQESNFYYLSGCTVPSSFLLLTFQSGTSLEHNPDIQLFIPKTEPADLMWSVPPPSLEEAARAYQVTRVAHPDTFIDTAGELKALADASVHVLPFDSSPFPALPQNLARTVSKANITITDRLLLPALHRARLTKDATEIDEIRRANTISSRAHEVVMPVLGQGVRRTIVPGKGAGVDRPLLPGEWMIEKEAEAEALFISSCRLEGAVHQAYLPIMAASTRALTLHHCCNDCEFAWGPIKPHDQHNHGYLGHNDEMRFIPQVLLIDAGCEWNCHASDITRTMPVGNGGKVTPEARAICELAAMVILKPGMHWDAVQLLCHRTLMRGFHRLGIFYTPESPGSGSWNAEEAILASRVSTAFFPHGLWHSLGLDVHDVPSASAPAITGAVLGHASFYTYLLPRLPLEEGMIVVLSYEADRRRRASLPDMRRAYVLCVGERAPVGHHDPPGGTASTRGSPRGSGGSRKVDADADVELLEAVDAAETNNATDEE
ncbi:Creatinase/aminopeptidase [Amylocystis lapponica]|nr:Creatinase/aminopeptidase [Amylocystis lapponica]